MIPSPPSTRAHLREVSQDVLGVEEDEIHHVARGEDPQLNERASPSPRTTPRSLPAQDRAPFAVFGGFDDGDRNQGSTLVIES